MQNKKEALLELRQKLEKMADDGLLPLASSAQQTVPGEGNPDAEIMFIGEAAGRNEAIQRRPFVGIAGKMLQPALEKQGLKREDVYISNVVKARPPENRDPLPEEIAAYKTLLDEEIDILQPSVIVTLGRFSMAKFIPDAKISHIHGRLHRVTIGAKQYYVLPFFHPAAALRRGSVMESFIADFEKLPKIVQWVKEQKSTQKMKDEIIDALW
jgi:DNA polymerase